MKEQIEHILNNYIAQYNSAPKITGKDGKPIKEFLKNKYSVIQMCEDGFPNEIKKVLNLENPYVAQGSAGQGKWTYYPWVAVRAETETKSITKGVYIVYLFDRKCENVYLTLNQGGTDLKESFESNKLENANRVLRDNAEKIRNVLSISDRLFIPGNDFELDHDDPNGEKPSLYKNGTIYYKKYSKGNLPSEDILVSDLKNMLAIYDSYLKTTISYKDFFKLENIPNLNSKISLKTYLKLRLVIDGISIIPGKQTQSSDEETCEINNLIFYGPPGTGKTYKMQTEYINNEKYKDHCFVTTFHQSFSYEEFVEGLKPFIPDGETEVQYRVEPGVFYQACEQAAKLAGYTSLDECIKDEANRKEKIQAAIKDNKVVLLCIDEINRANVSSAFGDLISLVETSKRLGANYEMIAKLPYSKKNFGVPANLMIVGTMNTADRSIQLLDSALRRRFKFVELLPNYDCLHDKNTNETAEKILRSMNNRIRALLDKDHQIGHSYFINKNESKEILEVMREDIIPLLEEYFYNETDKIRIVLNETDDLLNDKENKHVKDYFYLIDDEATASIKNTQDFDDDKIIYKLNEKISKVKDDIIAEAFLTHIIQEPKANSEQGV